MYIQFGAANLRNQIINYYDSNGTGQTYDSSKADRAFNSKNIEVGTVGIYKPTPGSSGFTGHTITVTGVTRDKNVLRITFIFIILYLSNTSEAPFASSPLN